MNTAVTRSRIHEMILEFVLVTLMDCLERNTYSFLHLVLLVFGCILDCGFHSAANICGALLVAKVYTNTAWLGVVGAFLQ